MFARMGAFEGVVLKVAVAHGLANAKKLMKAVSEGKVSYHFIEVMACPGGCLGGGGQPIPTNLEIRKNVHKQYMLKMKDYLYENHTKTLKFK